VVVSVVGGRAPTVATMLPGVRARRCERRRLVEVDRRSRLRAESALMHALLLDASDLVRDGWAQRCWFVARDERDGRVRVGPQNLHELAGRQVVEVCLVGAVVHAAGGVAHAGSQPVQRALDATCRAVPRACALVPISCCSSRARSRPDSLERPGRQNGR
jgi:hypothetical protein